MISSGIKPAVMTPLSMGKKTTGQPNKSTDCL
jgi:hypothetical protein